MVKSVDRPRSGPGRRLYRRYLYLDAESIGWPIEPAMMALVRALVLLINLLTNDKFSQGFEARCFDKYLPRPPAQSLANTEDSAISYVIGQHAII